MVLYDNILNACGGVAHDSCKFFAGGMTGFVVPIYFYLLLLI